MKEKKKVELKVGAIYRNGFNEQVHIINNLKFNGYDYVGDNNKCYNYNGRYDIVKETDEDLLELVSLAKVGTKFYYLDDWQPCMEIIRNIEGEYLNVCHCKKCQAKIGTDQEHHKYDTAHKIKDVFFSIDELKMQLNHKIDVEIDKLK